MRSIATYIIPKLVGAAGLYIYGMGGYQQFKQQHKINLNNDLAYTGADASIDNLFLSTQNPTVADTRNFTTNFKKFPTGIVYMFKSLGSAAGAAFGSLLENGLPLLMSIGAIWGLRGRNRVLNCVSAGLLIFSSIPIIKNILGMKDSSVMRNVI